MNDAQPLPKFGPIVASDRADGPPRGGPIVLVHGAWVGEWCWGPVIARLRPTGRFVHAVSLRGHGLRSAEGGPHITLADHVDDVVAAIELFDLHNITLVGHSYGGKVISQVWDRLHHRIGELVYLDAHAPVGTVVSQGAAVRYADESGMIPFSHYLPDPVEFGGQAAVDWFLKRVLPHSAATLEAEWTPKLPVTVDKTYVFACAEPESPFAAYAAEAERLGDWRYFEVDSSHWLVVADPETVAAIITRDR